MNVFEISRNWFNYSFDNPEKVKPVHTAIYFFAIEHCNRLGWKDKFGFPSQMVMEAVGIKNWRTYSKALNDIVDFGFIQMIETSKNQYSSNIIAIVKNTKAPTKALDKALQKHSTKQGQSTVSIDIQFNKEQETIVDEIYNSYPSTCPIKKRTTSKSTKDKEKIKILLKTNTADELKEIIKRYIADCKKSETYVKNFKTFLNNLPDYSHLDKPQVMERTEHLTKGFCRMILQVPPELQKQLDKGYTTEQIKTWAEC